MENALLPMIILMTSKIPGFSDGVMYNKDIYGYDIFLHYITYE